MTDGDADSRWHRLNVRVRYCECDPMGVAHHAAIVPWLEMARTEMLRELGETYAEMESAGYLLVVTRLNVRYRRPIRYDDLVEVQTRVADVSRVKLRHEYEVRVVEPASRVGVAGGLASLASSAGPCVSAETELACVGRDGRAQPLPGVLGRLRGAGSASARATAGGAGGRAER